LKQESYKADTPFVSRIRVPNGGKVRRQVHLIATGFEVDWMGAAGPSRRAQWFGCERNLLRSASHSKLRHDVGFLARDTRPNIHHLTSAQAMNPLIRGISRARSAALARTAKHPASPSSIHSRQVVQIPVLYRQSTTVTTAKMPTYIVSSSPWSSTAAQSIPALGAPGWLTL